MKTKNKTAPGFFARTASEWKGMRFFCGNELCRLDWIISVLILAFPVCDLCAFRRETYGKPFVPHV